MQRNRPVLFKGRHFEAEIIILLTPGLRARAANAVEIDVDGAEIRD